MIICDQYSFVPLAQIGPGDFGSALMMVVAVAGLAIVGGYTFSYASHVFSVIAEGTAAGQNEITWPDEPLVDRLGKAAIMAWVFLVSASAPYIVGKICAGNGIGAWIFTLTGFGIVFPVIVLSVRSSNSLFGIINSEVVARIAKRPEYWACYYIAIAPVLLVLGLSAWAAFHFNLLVAIVAALAAATCLLISSRLIGRLALLVGRTPTMRREKPDESESPPFDLGAVADTAAARSHGGQRHTRSTYGMRDSKAPEPTTASPTPSLKRIWVEEGADDPYALADAANPPKAPELPREFAQPSEYEMKLALRSRPPAPPKHPWLESTYTFPFNPSNWGPLLTLTIGLSISAGFARMLASAM